jgi:galactofuranosylgalactofuranosylrhamnosyl-N-acetylglucosaminyl-diphospho-decaprenol beta-1,5/1,6-galactofuranosyltransferase
VTAGEPEVLQHLVVPTLEVCPRSDLYVRLGPGTELSTLDGCLRLERDGEVSFDTYFGCFSATRWSRATSVRRVDLQLELTGAVHAEVVCSDGLREERVVLAADLTSDGGLRELTLPPLAEIGDGLLYVRLRGLAERSEVRGGRWVTDERPPDEVRLGVIITTFNRPEFVQANIARLLRGVEETPEWGRHLRVLVVDNGRNLELDIPPGELVRVVPNPNLGGAGGFARGLRILRDDGWATHALFMDDDVRFEAESVRRAHALLAFAADPQLCVHGSMLSADRHSELFEAGSDYRRRTVYPLEPVGRGRDLSDWDAVLLGDRDGPFDYGAWWFFAFPLALTGDNPLPMFVRGDDICWGLLHAGRHTLTAPGIAVWHQDFDVKLSPVGWFYETRNFALADVLADEGYRWWHMERRFLDSVLRPLLAFKYDTAEHVLRGMDAFMAGPEQWMATDQAKLHGELGRGKGERIARLPADLAGIPMEPPASAPRRLAGAAAAVLTLGGNLLPARLRTRQPTAAVPLQNRGLVASLTRDDVVYRHELRPEGFVAGRDRPRFFGLLRRIVRLALVIPVRFGGVARAYRRAYPRMVSDDYWARQAEDQLSANGGPSTSTSSNGPSSRRLAATEG